jgi:two-component system, NarL family, nitrate/nitrite response regulator NarL
MQVLKLVTENIRILLVDDQTIVRSAMRMLIESRSELKVMGEVSNHTECLKVVASDEPDIILFAVNEDTDVDFLPELLAITKQARVLILTGLRDPDVHQRAIRLGAKGVVLKDTAPEDFLKAIEKVHTGEVWLDRATTANVLARLVRTNHEMDLEATKIATLTKRERETIALIGEGLKNKQIAARLFISEATVRHHLTSIFSKLTVSDRLELIIYAYCHGLIKPAT